MQTTVYSTQSLGVTGSWATNAIKAEKTYILRGNDAVDAIKATGTVTVAVLPTAGDTLNIGGQIYTAVSSEAGSSQFLIGSTVAATATNIAGVINGFATATVSGAVVTVTAVEGGVSGNEIQMVASSTSSLTLSGAYLTGGVNYVAGSGATIGRAFSISDEENQAVQGLADSDEFAGIFVNPKNQAIYNNLTPTLTVPDGSQGSLAVSGYIYVTMTEDCSTGDLVYATANGTLNVTNTNTQILGAKVIKGGASGTVVEIGLIPQTTA